MEGSYQLSAAPLGGTGMWGEGLVRIGALVGLSVRLCVYPCSSFGVKAVCETCSSAVGGVLPAFSRSPRDVQPSPPPQPCLLRELASGCKQC